MSGLPGNASFLPVMIINAIGNGEFDMDRGRFGFAKSDSSGSTDNTSVLEAMRVLSLYGIFGKFDQDNSKKSGGKNRTKRRRKISLRKYK